MNGTMTMDQVIALVSAFAPDHAKKVREAFGVGDVRADQRPGYIHLTQWEKRYFERRAPKVLQVMEHACKEWRSDNRSLRVKRWLEAVDETLLSLREAIPETSLAFLLRKGVQTLANDWYIQTPRDWQDYCEVYGSDGVAEWHAPLYGSVIAGRVQSGDRFPEGKVVGEDTVIVNYKFGLIESFERELFDDDKTGQIKDRAKRLGQSMAVTESVYAAFRFIGTARTYQNLSVPASNYSTTTASGATVTTPFSTALGNRPTTFAPLSLTGLKRAYSAGLNMLDPLGAKIVTNYNCLLHSPMDALHAPLLVTPPAGVPYYPAVPGSGDASQTAGTAAAGFPGGFFGANPFMGLGIRPVMVRYFPDWAWSFGQKAMGFLFQERDPLEVIQENPAAGAAFEVDAYRFRSRRRFEAEWGPGGSRFWFLGDDGSVAGQF